MKYTIQAPSSFSACEAEFLCQLHQTPPDAHLVIDMGLVTYLKPQDIMLLFLTTRELALKTGYRVELTQLFEAHLKYLERMDFFALAAEWVFTKQPCGERWQRNPDSLSCQAIMQISTSADIAHKAAPRVRAIAETWGQVLTPDGVDAIVAIVDELCANAIEHGKQPGYVMIQRYQSSFAGTVEVQIAVGDMGQGIRQSLMHTYGAMGVATDADYIMCALNGKSARGEGNGGDGLQLVRRIIRPTGSWLRIRSGSGSVRLAGEQALIHTNHPFLIGTQAIVVLHADT